MLPNDKLTLNSVSAEMDRKREDLEKTNERENTEKLLCVLRELWIEIDAELQENSAKRAALKDRRAILKNALASIKDNADIEGTSEEVDDLITAINGELYPMRIEINHSFGRGGNGGISSGDLLASSVLIAAVPSAAATKLYFDETLREERHRAFIDRIRCHRPG